MARQPKITRLEVHHFAWEIPGLGIEDNGFNAVYQPGCRGRQTGYVLRIETDQGLAGEYVGGQAASYAQVGIYTCGYSDELDAIDANGHVPVPRGPGLGVTVDWAWVKAHEVSKAV